MIIVVVGHRGELWQKVVVPKALSWYDPGLADNRYGKDRGKDGEHA